jgi:hypothetical protein
MPARSSDSTPVNGAIRRSASPLGVGRNDSSTSPGTRVTAKPVAAPFGV